LGWLWQFLIFILGARFIVRIINSLHRSFPSRIADGRKTPPPPIPAKHHIAREVDEIVYDSLRRCGAGVFVLWGIPHSGKTVTAVSVANRIWRDGRGVFYIDASKETARTGGNKDRETAEAWFRRSLGVKRDDMDFTDHFAKGSGGVEDQAPPMTTVIIDQYEFVEDLEGMDTLITSLGHVGYLQKNFVVMLCIADASVAKRIVDLNGRRKIQLFRSGPALCRWKSAEVGGLVEALVSCGECSRHDASALIELGERSSSAGCVVSVVDMPETLQHAMASADEEWALWKSGIGALDWQAGQ